MKLNYLTFALNLKLIFMKQYFTLFIFLLTLIPIHAQYNVLMPVEIYKEEEKKCGLLTHDNQFAFLSYPTFSPWGQKGLSFDYGSMTLTLRIAREPTPEEYDTSPSYTWHNQYEIKIDKTIADALFSLFTSAIYSASFMGDTSMIMDGCYYEFHIGNMYGGYTRSPNTKSNCGRLVKIAEEVCRCVKNQDTAFLKSLLNEMYALTDIFVSYYPFEVPKWIIYDIHKRNKVKGPSVGLHFQSIKRGSK